MQTSRQDIKEMLNDKKFIFMENGELINKGFIFLEETFKNKNWKLTKNEPSHIIYVKNECETEYFEITIDSKKIYISFPLKNSIYQYKTGFDSYYKAVEYIENKLNEI